MISLRRAAMAAVFISSIAPVSIIGAQRPFAGDSVNPRRAMLEERLRQRTADIVKRRLQLTDDQMKQLQETNSRFEKQRMDLMGRERETRHELRQQILAGDDANQNRVAQLLDQAMQIERQRLDLQQSEQRELAKFLKPVQRAKLFGLQAEMRRRAQELRNRRMQGIGIPGRGMQGGPMGPPMGPRRNLPAGPRRFEQ